MAAGIRPEGDGGLVVVVGCSEDGSLIEPDDDIVRRQSENTDKTTNARSDRVGQMRSRRSKIDVNSRVGRDAEEVRGGACERVYQRKRE